MSLSRNTSHGAGRPPPTHHHPDYFIDFNEDFHFNVNEFGAIWLLNSGDDEENEGHPVIPSFGYIPPVGEDDYDTDDEEEDEDERGYVIFSNSDDDESDEEDDTDDSEFTEDSEDYFESGGESEDSGYNSDFSFEESPESSRSSSSQAVPWDLYTWARNPCFLPASSNVPHTDPLAFQEQLNSWCMMMSARGGVPSSAPHLVARCGQGPDEALGEAGESSDGVPLNERHRSESSDYYGDSSTSGCSSSRKRNWEDDSDSEHIAPKRQRWSDSDSD
ncbi:unnamed protein product [Merluccius merluccius]